MQYDRQLCYIGGIVSQKLLRSNNSPEFLLCPGLTLNRSPLPISLPIALSVDTEKSQMTTTNLGRKGLKTCGKLVTDVPRGSGNMAALCKNDGMPSRVSICQRRRNVSQQCREMKCEEGRHGRSGGRWEGREFVTCSMTAPRCN